MKAIIKKLNDRKKRLQNEKRKKDCLYINRPIKNNDEDQIGVAVYVEKIIQAITGGAEIIAITSDFGTGKSSVISLLQQEKQFKKWFSKYKFVTISLWGFLKENNVIEIHKNFIYQFVSCLNRKSGSHLSKKMSKNFGVIKVGFGNRKASFGVFCGAIFFLMAEVIRRYTKETLQWLQNFSENINDTGLQNVSALLYLGAVAVLFIIIIRTDIVFSSPKSEGKREMDENIIIDYYRMQVLNRGWNKHYVVVIEDLDRIRNPQIVFDFLIELRKYYIPERHKQGKKIIENKVTFILCIKAAAQLQRELDNWNVAEKANYIDVQEKYSKIFDLIIQLKKINIDNYDVILEGLLTQKKEYLFDKNLAQKDENGEIIISSIEGIQWIIRGENLNIREIKQRLNDAFVLYEALIRKFREKRISFEKCIIVSYLNNVYPNDMLLIDDYTFEKCIDRYIQNGKIYNKSLRGLTQKFVEELQIFVERRYIEEDYRVYFYNYPKGSKLYNIFELKVLRAILYDLETEDDFETALNNVDNTIIYAAMDKIVALGVKIPKVALRHKKIMQIIMKEYHEKLVEYIESGLIYSKNEIARTTEEVDNILMFVFAYSANQQKIIQKIIEVWNSSISKESLLEIRYMLCEKHVKKIKLFKKLFFENNPLITIEEIELLKDTMGLVWELFNYDSPMFEQSFFEEMQQIISEETILEHNVQVFYTKSYNMFDKSIVVSKITALLEKEEVIPEKIENILFEAIGEGAYTAHSYINLLKEKKYSEKSIHNIHQIQWNSGLSKELCYALYKQEYYLDYLVNMGMDYSQDIDYIDEKLVQTIHTHAHELYERSEVVFGLIRIRLLQLKLELKYNILFETPFQGISYRELEVINNTDRAIALMTKNIPVISINNLIEYFNARYQNPRRTALIIDYFFNSYTQQNFADIFYQLDMENIIFRKMSRVNRDRIINNIKKIGMVKTMTQKLRFMKFTKLLVEEFEKELCGRTEYETEYVQIINIVDEPTRQTIKNIEKFGQVHVFGEKVTKKLLEAKLYKDYIYSVSVRKKKFSMPKDEELLLAAEEIFIANRWEKIMNLLCDNVEFMTYMIEKENYKGSFINKKKFVGVKQNVNMLDDLFATCTDSDIISYLCHIEGFRDDEAEYKYIVLLEGRTNILRNLDVYKYTYKLINDSSIRRKYTRMRNLIIDKSN